MRILFTGSRHWTDEDRVRRVLGRIALWTTDSRNPPTAIVGDCPTGLDAILTRLWREMLPDYPIEVFRADWDGYGKAAGPLRNQAMVASGIDRCYAFRVDGVGSRGTDSCVRMAGGWCVHR